MAGRSVLGQWVELRERSPCSLPGSQGTMLGSTLSADPKILLEMKNGVVVFPHLLSFVIWGASFLEIHGAALRTGRKG